MIIVRGDGGTSHTRTPYINPGSPYTTSLSAGVITDNPIVAEPEDDSEEDPSFEPEQPSIARLRRSAAEQARNRILAQAVSEWNLTLTLNYTSI